MTNPPDAVSGAATPAQQSSGVCKCGHDKTDHASRASVCLRCSLCIQFEPAATPEAQIPECVHAPESRGVIELEPMTDKDAAAKLREIFDDLQTRFHDQWDWMDADFSLMVLEAFLEAARTESAALRVERDRSWNEAIDAARNVAACYVDGEYLQRRLIMLARPIPAGKPE